MPNDTDVLLSSSEAAERIGVQRSTIERAVRAGRLAPVHRGHGIRGAMLFRQSDVEALAAARRTTPHPSDAVAASPRDGAGLHH